MGKKSKAGNTNAKKLVEVGNRMIKTAGQSRGGMSSFCLTAAEEQFTMFHPEQLLVFPCDSLTVMVMPH